MAQVLPSQLIFAAKMDTGADHSSINANNIKIFSREGKQWVQFDIKNQRGESATLERPLVRIAKIKRHTSAADQRPVVHLKFCLHKTCRIAETNLADRSRFDYSLLIGRSAMGEDFIIAPSKRNTRQPSCDKKCL